MSVLTYFPEGTTSVSGDDELRSLHKTCALLYDAYGNKACPQFPEGSEPLVGDDEQRLVQKINALLS